ncbi:MAG TPA: inositol monophosphatase family protein [Ilumatobacter sp.]|nr:inositol monophosphatase family protein [Ilumatobacter sp.]
MIQHAELRDLCVGYVRRAGDLAREGRVAAREGVGLGALTKSTATDLVTEFDRAAEQVIVAAIRADRPDDAIVGEEGADQPGTTGYAWHVDPIDGTTNFVYDLPTWACSVGVTYDGVGVAGAVYAPMLDELYAAAIGPDSGAATLNGRPIAPSAVTDPALALVATGFAYQAATRAHQARRVAFLADQVRDFRRFGAASYDLCLVASGRVDAYYEAGLNSWDMVAGDVICRAAGARTSDWSGGPVRPAELLAAAPGLHAPFLELFDRAAANGV